MDLTCHRISLQKISQLSCDIFTYGVLAVVLVVIVSAVAVTGLLVVLAVVLVAAVAVTILVAVLITVMVLQD